MTSDRLLALALALLGLTILAGIVLPQLPGELVEQPTGSRWLAETSSRFGSLGKMMQEAGLFSLWQSPWLRLLLGLLAFILLLRLAQSIARLRPAEPALLAAEARQWPFQTSFSLHTSLDTSLAELADDLRQEGWWVAVSQSTSEAHVAAERSRWSLLAAPAVYTGALLALAALWLGQTFGWQETGLVLLPGQPVALQHANGATLTLVDVDESAPAVMLQQDGAAAESEKFSAGGAARLPGMTVQRTSAGQMLAVSGFDAAGNPLQLRLLDEQAPSQPTVYLVFDQPRAERAFLAPARQLAFSVVAFPALPERGFKGPTFLVQALQAYAGQSDPVFNEFVEGDANLPIGDDRYELRSGEYATVRVSHDPGRPLLALGVLAMLAGVLLSVVRPTGQLYLHLYLRQRNTVQVSAWLRASTIWRQGSRWLMAWAATYSQETGPTERHP
jgi:cytochrome c biogenesis protein ResB